MRKNIYNLLLKNFVSKLLAKLGFYNKISFLQNYLINLNLEELKPRFSNYPFLSGDSFLTLSDIAFLQNRKDKLILREETSPKICFLEVSYFNSLRNIDFLYNYKKIIIHNGDQSPNPEFIKRLVDKKIYVYAVNILNKSKYLIPIPIGIENLYLGRNGSMHFFNPIKINNLIENKEKMILCSFSNSTNPIIRNKLSQDCISYGCENKFYSLSNYRKELAKSYFVLSPPGNGFDCHRTWEAIYLKTIPVVLRSYFAFSHLNLPILKVDSFEEFFVLTDNEKLALYNDLIKSKKDPMYIDWWIINIRSNK